MMAVVNSTITNSLLLTTLLANCQLVTVPLTTSVARGGQLVSGREALSAGGDDLGSQEKIATKDDASFISRDAPPNSSSKSSGKQKSHKSSGSSKSANNANEVAEDTDPGAVMYIIVVLVFYSTGVMVMIVRYLKTEKKELEEEVTLENFFNSMPDKRVEKEYTVNRVAIRAFHTLTSISYDDEELENMDLGSEPEGDFPDRKRAHDSASQPLLVTDL